MSKEELLKSIEKIQLEGCGKLISFQTETLDDENSVFFQWDVCSGLNLKEFIDFNFEYYKIKSITRLELTKYGCLFVYVKKWGLYDLFI